MASEDSMEIIRANQNLEAYQRRITALEKELREKEAHIGLLVEVAEKAKEILKPCLDEPERRAFWILVEVLTNPGIQAEVERMRKLEEENKTMLRILKSITDDITDERILYSSFDNLKPHWKLAQEIVKNNTGGLR